MVAMTSTRKVCWSSGAWPKDAVRCEPLQVELVFFVCSVLDDEPFPVSGEDGLQALALAQYLVAAGQRGRSVYPGPTNDEARSVPG